MSIKIDDSFVSVEIGGRVIATARDRTDGWCEVDYWPRFFDRHQAVTALTTTELLESGGERRPARGGTAEGTGMTDRLIMVTTPPWPPSRRSQP